MIRIGHMGCGCGSWRLALVLALVLLLAASEGARAEPAPSGTPPDLGALARISVELEAGRPEQALEQLAQFDAGALADHVALLRAKLLHQLGRRDEALAAARVGLAANPPVELRARLHQEMATLHLEQDNLADAYQDQRNAWQSTRDSQLAASMAMDLARAFEQRKRPGSALQLYRRIWTDWTLSDVSAEAFRRAEKLTLGTGAAPPSPRPLLERAHRLRQASRCDDALAGYQEVLARDGLTAVERRSAAEGSADCLFQRRRYPEAAAAFRALAKSDRNDFESAIYAARALARGGESEQAVAEFQAIIKRGAPTVRARARYLMAVTQRTDEPKRFLELMRQIEKQKAAPELAALARWQLAWDDLKAQNYKAALPRLAGLARGAISDIEVQRGLYWQAVAKLGAGQAAVGRAELASLAEKLPLSYYGLIAADRLGQPPRLEHSFVGERDLSAGYPPALRTRWLLEAGLDEYAALELASWSASAQMSRDERLAAAQLLHQIGRHDEAVRTIINGFGETLEQGIDPAWRDAWELAWPRPFSPWVRSAISEFAFDPSLVYAIMREESRYQPAIASSAGAMGLMQIIPPTGERIARDLGVAEFSPERLYDPSTNIRFGTYYLKLLISQFKGSQPRAIASYNAGPEIVSQWLAHDGRLPDDAFVESVPYGETRRYLRRVLRSYRVYELLYDRDGQLRAATPAAPIPAALQSAESQRSGAPDR